MVYPPPPWWVKPPKRSRLKRMAMVAGGLILVVSVILNVELLALVVASPGDGMRTTVLREGNDDEIVAVYKVDGVINAAAAGRFDRFAREVLRDENVKAIVMRVVSPGGGMSSSDQIYARVRKLQEADKKVIVSMGGVAASGGYYISAPADAIVAEPTTVTGSVGVIAGWLVVKGTLNKIGVEPVVIKSSNSREWKDEFSSLQKPSSRQLKHIQEVLDKMQSRFEHVIRTGRGGKLKTNIITVDKGEDAPGAEYTEIEPFNGKIYLADEAKQLGLIDNIGYEADAFALAAELAGLAEPKVVRYTHRRGLLSALMKLTGPDSIKTATDTVEELQTPRIMAIWRAQ